MLPNIDLRIANMVKALEQVILPALPVGEKLARDQAMLIVGQLGMLGDQWKDALQYERVSLDDLIGLAQTLLPEARGTLATALDVARSCDRDDITALERANIDLGRAVDIVILGGEDHVPLSPAAINAVLSYGLRHARRERTWFKSNRLDPDQGDLPDIATMLAQTG